MANPSRAAWLVLAVLLLASLALFAVGPSGAGADAPALFAAALLVAPASAALIAALLLVRLQHDFEALADFVRQREGELPPPRSAEAGPLFAAAALLRARSLELEALETAAGDAVEAAENLRVGFVASMGHDLRAPLNAIVGFADLMVMDSSTPVAPSQRQSVEIVRRSAQDLLVLLDQILDWARFEAGRITLSPTEHAASSLIHAAIDEARLRSADRGLRVEAQVPDVLPSISVDRDRFVEALLGLFDHATRTANAPRVVVRAQAIASDSNDMALRIEVHDPALRIRTADQGTFFEPFRPSFAPSGQRIAGLGLGPALARALIRAHGGDVWFASDANKGTTFYLRLPVADSGQAGNQSDPGIGSRGARMPAT